MATSDVTYVHFRPDIGKTRTKTKMVYQITGWRIKPQRLIARYMHALLVTVSMIVSTKIHLCASKQNISFDSGSL